MAPPSKAKVMKTIRAHEGELRALGVETVFLFGSVARGDATVDSDVDLFFDYKPSVRGLDVIGLYMALEDLFDGPVDVVARNSIHAALKPHIEADALQVF